MSDKSKLQKKIDEINSKIKYHNDLYYRQNTNKISDSEYDELVNEKKEILQSNLNLVDDLKFGVEPDSKFQKIVHKKQMLSLQNIYNEEELTDLLKRFEKLTSVQNVEVICEPKIDGVSLSVIYEKGKVKYVVTRGNGFVGENVTHNALSFLPEELSNAPDFIEIRGEVFVNREDFAKINIENKFINPRNMASGSLRLLDNKVAGDRYLRFIAYGIGECSKEFKTHSEMLVQYKKWGFDITDYIVTEKKEDILDYYNKIYSKRDTIPYDIDGIVYKINSTQLQEKLGNTAKYPRYAAAHKFPSFQGKTKVEDITLQVGRSGVITPVAELSPINIGGVTINRASLHNFDLIAKKDIRIGDVVLLERSGDVIPNIIEVDLSLRAEIAGYQAPKNCPSCGGILEKLDDEAALYCGNERECRAQILGKLIHFVSNDGFNITGLGKKQIEFFFEKGIIT